ncbi:MAG: hypothetical protein IJT70_00965 [Clostridia bacterium]|nr:hypothetical protein [Clostridia bacterium]
MKNKKNSSAPDAVYVNGKLTNGKNGIDGKTEDAKRIVQKRIEKQAVEHKEVHAEKRVTASRAERRDPSDIDSENYTRRTHSSSGSRRKKKSRFSRFFKAFAPTLGALAVVAALIIFVVLSDSGNSPSEGGAQPQANQPYAPAADFIDLDEDEELKLDKAEINLKYVIPTSNVYNEDGQPLVALNRNETGDISDVVFYKYRSNGEPVSEKNYSPEGELLSKTVYDADEDGCVKSVFSTRKNSKGNYSGSILEECDESGLVKKKTQFTATGVIDSYSYPEYNSKGLIIAETEYSAYGMMSNRSEYTYDENDKVTELHQFDANDMPTASTYWEYDEAGRVIKESYYLKNTCRSFNEYVYNDDGSYTMTANTLIDEAKMIYDKKVFKGK